MEDDKLIRAEKNNDGLSKVDLNLNDVGIYLCIYRVGKYGSSRLNKHCV